MMHAMPSGFLFFGAFHAIGMLAFVIGVFFLIFWAIKHLTGHQLYSWGWTLVASGVVLCLLSLLTLSFGGGNYEGHFRMKDKDGMMEEHGEGMSMNGIVKALEGKTGDDFDRAFLQLMIEHHQGAVDMANAALESAGHDEIKDLSDSILGSQQGEIDQMMQWEQDWGFTE